MFIVIKVIEPDWRNILKGNFENILQSFTNFATYSTLFLRDYYHVESSLDDQHQILKKVLQHHYPYLSYDVVFIGVN